MRQVPNGNLWRHIQARTASMIGIVLALGILIGIATLTILNLHSTSKHLAAVQQRTEIGDAYGAIDLAVAQAQVHSWYYLQTGDERERDLIVQSIGDILAADARVKEVGTEDDRSFIIALEARFGPQLEDGMRIMAGSDPGTGAPNSLGNIAVLNDLAQALAEPAEASRAEASFKLDTLSEKFNTGSTRVLAALVFGLPMLGLLSFAVSRYEQREARESAELKRLSQAALTDGLTGLGNHRAFQEDLGREFSRASRSERPLSVAMIDIDDFKEINDTRGHAQGDSVLAELGKLMSYLLGEDRAYRVGGDEFALILSEQELQEATAALDRLRKSVTDGLPGVTISIGTSSTDRGLHSPSLLRDYADAALYVAKHRGKNKVVAYEPGMNYGPDITAPKMTAIRKILHTREVKVWFQPIFKLDTGRLLAFEALLRLPDFPQLSGPSEAFEIARHMGRTLDLDMLIIDSALETGRTLPDDCRLFINIDPATLIHMDFDPNQLRSLVDRHGLTPHKIVLELTEATDAPVSLVIKQLDALRDRGFGIALDDVGTGNSGLEMLRVVKFDYVKIDRTVILDAMKGGPGRAVILAIVAFARESDTYLIAEGVENKEMLEAIEFDEGDLRKFWVQAVQGFLFGEPRESVEAYLGSPEGN